MAKFQVEFTFVYEVDAQDEAEATSIACIRHDDRYKAGFGEPNIVEVEEITWK